MWYIWLILAGVFVIGEVLTSGFLIFWFGLAALIAMAVSFITDNIIIQTTVFLISSVILILATKPLVKKFAKVETTKTNAFSLIDKKGIVTKDISSINSTGQVKVEGELWSATGDNDMEISKATEVKIKEIKGVKLIVTPIK